MVPAIPHAASPSMGILTPKPPKKAATGTGAENVQHEDMPPTAMTNVSTRGWAEAGMGARCTMTATRPRAADLMRFIRLQPAVGGGVVWRAASPANCFFIFSPGEVVVWGFEL